MGSVGTTVWVDENHEFAPGGGTSHSYSIKIVVPGSVLTSGHGERLLGALRVIESVGHQIAALSRGDSVTDA